MRTTKEVFDFYRDLKEIEVGINPSLILFAEWVLNHRFQTKGESKKVRNFVEDIKELAKARRRNKLHG